MLLLVVMSKIQMSSVWMSNECFFQPWGWSLAVSSTGNKPIVLFWKKKLRSKRELPSAHSWGLQWWLHNLVKAIPLITVTFKPQNFYWWYLWEHFDFLSVGTVAKESQMSLCYNGELHHLPAENPKCISKHYHTLASVTLTHGDFWVICKGRKNRNIIKEFCSILLLNIDQT